MITDKELRESRSVVQRLIKESLILPADREYQDFFLAKANQALETAHLIVKVSLSPELKSQLQISSSYVGYMWAINAAYYSMFYAATSLLAKYNHRIKGEQGIHVLTYHALIYYFLDNDKKLSKHILEQYRQAGEEVVELMQIAEQQAREKIEQVKFELGKRREFTYEMGRIAEKAKAETSLRRAEEFLTLVKELIL